MSQNPHKPHSSEEKLSALEDDQESLDNSEQSIRKRIQQSVPGSRGDDTPKCKHNCPSFKKKKVQFCVFCSGDGDGVL